jgi:hypothetical protein
LTIWVIAGLLGMATGLRIGWALVNRQSVVSSAMIVALGSLAVLALLNWPPVTLLVDTALGWPNIAIGLSEVALVASAAGSCVMITSVASTRNPSAVRNLAVIQYCVAALIAAVAVGLFIVSGRQPEMTPREYLSRNLGAANTALHWLVPLLYVLLALTLVSWVGMRLANPTRRGRALFVFTIGIALIVASSAFVLIRVRAPVPEKQVWCQDIHVRVGDGGGERGDILALENLRELVANADVHVGHTHLLQDSEQRLHKSDRVPVLPLLPLCEHPRRQRIVMRLADE